MSEPYQWQPTDAPLTHEYDDCAFLVLLDVYFRNGRRALPRDLVLICSLVGADDGWLRVATVHALEAYFTRTAAGWVLSDRCAEQEPEPPKQGARKRPRGRALQSTEGRQS